MRMVDVNSIKPGLYRIVWKHGHGTSVGSIWIGSDGTRWLAPTNWVSPSNEKKAWRMVESVELIKED